MSLDRRQFIILAAAAMSGCKATGGGAAGSEPATFITVDAGPVDQYKADGVYAGFKDRGFFLIRSGPQFYAASAICTHRACKLDVEPDHSFACKCHGSTFDSQGHVTKGPALRDLPPLTLTIDPQGHVQVRMPAS